MERRNSWASAAVMDKSCSSMKYMRFLSCIHTLISSVWQVSTMKKSITLMPNIVNYCIPNLTVIMSTLDSTPETMSDRSEISIIYLYACVLCEGWTTVLVLNPGKAKHNNFLCIFTYSETMNFAEGSLFLQLIHRSLHYRLQWSTGCTVTKWHISNGSKVGAR